MADPPSYATGGVGVGGGLGLGPFTTCQRTRSRVATESSMELCPAAPADWIVCPKNSFALETMNEKFADVVARKRDLQ